MTRSASDSTSSGPSSVSIVVRRKAAEVFLAGQHHHVGIAAKLRRAVQHAGLAAHEERTHVVPPQSRKDSENRARGQGILPVPGTSARAWKTPRAAGPASWRTTPPIHRPRAKPSRCRWYPCPRFYLAGSGRCAHGRAAEKPRAADLPRARWRVTPTGCAGAAETPPRRPVPRRRPPPSPAPARRPRFRPRSCSRPRRTAPSTGNSRRRGCPRRRRR